MSDWSRRRALQALGTATTVAVAGCSTGGDGFEDPPDTGRGDPVEEYALRKVRETGGGALFWQRGEGGGNGGDDGGEERPPGGYEYVAAEDDVASLAFAPDSDAAAELSAFVAATDFESSSVLVQETAVRECYDLRLRGVWRDGDGLETAYCSRLRPADDACSTDARDTVGVAVRVPFSLADAGGFGSSWGSNCDSRPVGVDADVGGGGGGA